MLPVSPVPLFICIQRPRLIEKKNAYFQLLSGKCKVSLWLNAFPFTVCHDISISG